MKGSAILKSIRLQNVRSLADTGEIPIKPLTVLVGGNSSGKSTFLRTFPLIRQSISKRIEGPILWAGDVDDYVDFGSFKETKGPDKKSIDISFTFEIKNNGGIFGSFPTSKLYPKLNSSCLVDYCISIHQKPSRFGRGEEVSTFEVKLNTHKIIIENLRRKDMPYTISVDDKPLPQLDENQKENGGNLQRFISMFVSLSQTIFGFQMPDLSGVWDALEEFVIQDKYDFPQSFEIISFLARVFLMEENPLDYLNNCTSDGQLDEVAKTQEEREVAEKVRTNIHEFWERFTLESKKRQDEIKTWFILFMLYSNIQQIELYITRYFRGVHYIAPLRATAERFYRLRNLAVDEIDYQGKNLAVFLNSLSKEQLQNFQNWTSKHFNFVVQLSTKAQHISVKIARDQNLAGVNISDSGFGYSQILPIVAQLWFLSSKLDEKSDDDEEIPIVIAIEQPELHLHPALQAKLVDAFIACIKNAEEHNRQFQLIIETHSETIVNKIGRNIARENFSADDAEVVLFEKKFDSNKSSVRISRYDEDGMLIDWPIGFFEAGGI